ncbi:2-succinyl-5-enolpyruvyl-6-hydroxy-3-cyclohexene-1-carboxylic-acid synthase [Agromyces mediolanus]|uniref:2-succinyl-5-enolpyruvyl-6-hydroxy-3- cyclohexene-1-carboxylic-acid synthase n=1 Tax=Agromyces mediolanus TaxID=41986 RepID=UPI00203E2C03|nr:2-succinyl-5-enolpyruvyl-6-hydroxy-3-cyclohexene-1-carboxylic-acid synthase [Agromyces mediolanus]MCM3657756.1 2-succinyl-5-enolpyruvyl-6-hydroxy-3-cyclohexene-1-carboxylic-acid synthase [Agromyces mediolanus]
MTDPDAAGGAPEASGPRRSPASDFAVALLAELERLGVTDVVVAPGSRSQALALAAAEFERAGRLRLHVRIDERSAGFLALGLGVETGHPAAVVATSGTAIANLHPAVLEAHHAGVPLLVLAADRPAELRGIRSNQTTMQPGIFAGAVRLERDVSAPEGAAGEPDAAAELARLAVAAAEGRDPSGDPVPHPGPGPVLLNLQLREPLSAPTGLPPRAETSRTADSVTPPGDRAAQPSHAGLLARGPRTVVVAGAGAGPAAEALARAGGWPLLAEITSGARFGPNLVPAYREVLAEPGLGDAVERVIVFGHPTLSREVPALVQRDGVETVVVAPSGVEWFNPGHRADRFERAVHVEPGAPVEGERAWLGRWLQAGRALAAESAPAEPVAVRSGVDETGHVTDFAAQRAFLDAQLGRMREPIGRRLLAESVWAVSWPHDRLVLGASRLIRDADRVVPGRRIHAHANRGLSGIDGTVATALGIALASQQPAGAGAEEASAAPAVRDTFDPAGGGDLAAMLARAAEVEQQLAAAKAGLAAQEARARAESSVTRVVLGDLTLLHDVGSLLLGAGETRPRILVVVGNDGGGTIFDSLEVAGSAPAEAFDRVQYTPQSVDLEALARAYGWRYRRAAMRSELEAALAEAVTEPTILEVPLSR